MKDAQSTTTPDTAPNTAIDVPQEIDMDAIGGTPDMLKMSANTNAPAIPTAHNMSTYDEDMTTAEQLALPPFTSPFPRLSCVTGEVRQESVIIFARILKAKNPTSSWKLCRLRDEEIPDIVLQIGLRILTRMNEDLSGSPYIPSSDQIV
jgi:hypothetical protein